MPGATELTALGNRGIPLTGDAIFRGAAPENGPSVHGVLGVIDGLAARTCATSPLAEGGPAGLASQPHGLPPSTRDLRTPRFTDRTALTVGGGSSVQPMTSSKPFSGCPGTGTGDDPTAGTADRAVPLKLYDAYAPASSLSDAWTAACPGPGDRLRGLEGHPPPDVDRAPDERDGSLVRLERHGLARARFRSEPTDQPEPSSVLRPGRRADPRLHRPRGGDLAPGRGLYPATPVWWDVNQTVDGPLGGEAPTPERSIRSHRKAGLAPTPFRRRVRLLRSGTAQTAVTFSAAGPF